MSEPEYVLLARLVRPQGRRGELVADILTDFPERFAERRDILLLAPAKPAVHPRPGQIEGHWLHQGRVVLKFKGVDSINEAEPLRGLLVAVAAAERTPLEEGAVYIADLIGCHVIDEASGTPLVIGNVTDVQREAVSADLLVVKPAEGEELLIPFAKAYLKQVDVAAKVIRMSLPEGLLSINTRTGADEQQYAGSE